MYGLNRSPTLANFQNMPMNLCPTASQPSLYNLSIHMDIWSVYIAFPSSPFFSVVQKRREYGVDICARADKEKNHKQE